MLIPADVKAAIESGALVRAKPITTYAGERRAVLLCRPIREALDGGRSDPDKTERQSWAKVEAAFSHFIEGGYVTEDLVKQLHPQKYEHWEFRCRKPRPSIRVFGRFVMPDVFVATHPVLRAMLGGMWSAEFEHEKLVCEDHCINAGITSVFTDNPKFRYEAYISENAIRKIGI